MKKRILSFTLVFALMLILSNAVPTSVPVSAASALPDNIKTDYVPGAITGNVITDNASQQNGILYTGGTNYNGFSRRAGETADNFDVTAATTTTGVYLLANRKIDDPHKYWTDTDGDNIYTWDGETYSYQYPLSGANIRRNWGTDTGKLGNVVFKFKVKLDNVLAGSAVINFGRYNNAYGGVKSGDNTYLTQIYTSTKRNEYPLEYNSKATGVSINSRNWTEFSGTFESNGLHSVDNYGYTLGFVEGTPKNVKVWFDAEAYMGIEYAYDIDVKADSTVWTHGTSEEIILDADILNQVGKTGGLSQSVTWYALTDDRTQEVSGFKFTEKNDGTTALKISRAVTAGSYDLVAVANENSELVKGITIKVDRKNTTEQHIALDFDDNADLDSVILTEGAQAILTNDGINGTKAMQVTKTSASDKVSFALCTEESNTYKISLWLKSITPPTAQKVYFDITNWAEDSGADATNTIEATLSEELTAGEWVYATAEYKAPGTGIRNGESVAILPDGEISIRVSDGAESTFLIDDFFVIPYVDNKVNTEELINNGKFDALSDFESWNIFIDSTNVTGDAIADYYIEDGYENGAIKITTVDAYDGFNTKQSLDIELCKKYEFSFYAKAMSEDTVGKKIWFFLMVDGDYRHINNSANPLLTTEWQKFTFEIDVNLITADIPESIRLGFRVGDNAELEAGLRPVYAVDNISLKQTGDTNFSVSSTFYGAVNSNAVLQFNFLDSTIGKFIYRIVKETANGDYVVQSDTTTVSMVRIDDVGELTDAKLRLDLFGLDGYGNYSQVHSEYLESHALTDTVTLRPNNYIWNDDIDTLSATLTYKSETDLKKLNVYGVLYDNNDRLVGYQKADMQVLSGEEQSITVSVDVKDTDGNPVDAVKVKFFAWFETSYAPATVSCEILKTDGEFIYVDSNSTALNEDGTFDAPYKTVEAARESWQSTLASTGKDSVYVVLKSGEYFQNEAIAFTMADCVNGKTLIFTTLSGEKAKISGGIHITGFEEYKNGIYMAKVPEGTNSRQLYINGIKATRARSVEDVGGFTNLDVGATTSTFKNNGLICTDASYADYKYPDELELAFIENWRHHYITADTITATEDGALFGFTENGNMEAWKKIVTLQTPATVPVYLENALELLDEPGEWYLDTHEHYLYYMPREFENILADDVVIPVTQELVTLTGTADAPVKNIQFKNIDFCYSAWNYPTTNRNYLCSQGAFYGTQTTVPGDTGSQLPDGAVELTNAHHITIDNCDFAHLGSMALRMVGAIQNCNIIGNEFYEISGAAMALGELEGTNVRNPSDKKYFITDNLIANNYIHKVADDYYSAAAISAGFPKNTTIRNNELADGAYSGFHIGWGWNSGSAAGTENFVIESNYIHNFMNWRVYDGAAIYTLGKTGGTKENPNIIRGNYIQDILKSPAGIYPDEGSTFWKITENVIDNHRYSTVYHSKESSMSSPSWLNIWTNSISDIYVEDNYSTTANYRNEGTRIEFEQADVYNNATWPQEALSIINQAGIENAYKDRFDFDVQILTVPTRVDVPAGTTVPFAYNMLSTKDKLCDLSDYEITVKSSNESVAIVTADSITGVSAGKTWITVKVLKHNGDAVEYYDEHTFCVVVS